MSWTPNAGPSSNRKESLWFRTDEGLVVPDDWRTSKNVYFSVNPVSTRRLSYQATRNKDVCAVNALFADFDGKDFVDEDEWRLHYSPPNLAGLDTAKVRGALQRARTAAIDAAFVEDPEEYKRRALFHVLELPVPPSVLVDSGGGYQAYWLLRDTVTVTDTNREVVASVQKAWVNFVGADKSAADLRRILRLPLTYNVKPKYAPNFPLVDFVFADFVRLYDFGALLALLPPKEKKRERSTPAGNWSQRPVPLASTTLPDCPAVRWYNSNTPILEVALRAGYREAGPERRLLSPQQTSGDSSVILNPASRGGRWANSLHHFSDKNPIGRSGLVRPADLRLVTEFGGDVDRCLAAIQSEAAAAGAPDFDGLHAIALHANIEPLVRARLVEIAKLEAQKAATAAALFAEYPTDRNEKLAISARKRAEKAANRAAAPLRGLPTIRAAMTAILEMFQATWEKYGALARHFSERGLAAQANISRQTVRDILQILEGWFVTKRGSGEKRAPRYELADPFIRLNVPPTRPDETERTSPSPTGLASGTLAADAPWRTHFNGDAFTYSTTPRADTDDEREKVREVGAAIRNGTSVKPKKGETVPDVQITGPVELRHDELPDDSWRNKLAAAYLTTQENRFAASLPSMNRRALMVIQFLAELGGVAKGAQLCRLMGIARNRLSETVRRLISLGLVTKPTRFKLALAPDWKSLLDNVVTQMPTYGTRAIRTVDHIDGSIAYQAHRKEEAEAIAASTPVEADRMTIRTNAIDKTITTLNARRGEIEEWAKAHLPPHKVRRVLRRTGSEADHEKAERQHLREVRVAILRSRLRQADKIADARNTVPSRARSGSCATTALPTPTSPECCTSLAMTRLPSLLPFTAI